MTSSVHADNGYQNQGAGQCAGNSPRSEKVLADMFLEDLGIVIDPQALRIFIRHRFERLSPLAHRIHDGKR